MKQEYAFKRHGARGGAREGKRNGMYRHGQFTKEALEERVFLCALIERSREALLTLSTSSVCLASEQSPIHREQD